MKPKTLFDKIWDAHVVKSIDGGPDVLYIDQHFIHEVTSPQAFDGLRKRGVQVFRPDKTLATADHNIPTVNQDQPIRDELSKRQVDTLNENCSDFGITLFGLNHPKNGIVHVIGPELGYTGRNDHSLRRQSHVNPWSIRHHSLWYWYQRGRDGTGFSMHPSTQAEKDENNRERKA